MTDSHFEQRSPAPSSLEKVIRELNHFSPEESKTLKEVPYEQLVAVLLRRKMEQNGPNFTLEQALEEIQKLEGSLANAKRIVLNTLHTDIKDKQVAAAQAPAQ